MEPKNLADAERQFRLRLRTNPKDAYALNGLGLLASLKGQEVSAEALLRRSIATGSQFSTPYVNLAEVLYRTGRIYEARDLLRSALQSFPKDARLHFALSKILRSRRLHDQAFELIEAAHQLDPDDKLILASYIGAKRHVCDWRDFDRDIATAEQAVTKGEEFPPFLLMTLGAPVQLQLRCAVRHAQGLSIAGQRRPPPKNSRLTGPNDGKIKVAYMSADFRAHATTFLISDVLAKHDRSRFMVFAYSLGAVGEDSYRTRIVNFVDVFRDLSQCKSVEAADIIRKDSIDILLDLNGYTEGSRPEILAQVPAPIQVSYLGFPGTMGAEFIHYIIGDQIVAPLQFQSACTEKIVHLPDCFQPNGWRHPSDGNQDTRKDWGLPETGFVFCSFANPYKITPRYFDIWMRLLQSVPDSVLWLLGRVDKVRRNLGNEAETRGVSAERLIFADGVSQAEHLARHRHADLVLDTLPVSAFTTASDALWAGVPFLTCLGETPAGRGGASILTAFGAPDLVTRSPEDYERLARELALDRPRLTEIRSEIGALRASSRLFDIARYTRALEAAFQQMQARRMAGLEPEPLAVALS